MRDTIEVKNWEQYFSDFNERNLARLAKLEIFGELGVQQEVKKMPFAGISVELKGADAPRIEIMLGGLSMEKKPHLTHNVPKVKKILRREREDNLDDAIEFESESGTKTLLYFEPGLEIPIAA